jgi:hypothetical protein
VEAAKAAALESFYCFGSETLGCAACFAEGNADFGP